MSFKRERVLKGLILAALLFSIHGSGMVCAEDCPKLFLRISGEGLFPYNIQWFEKSNEMYFGLASGSISSKAAANAAEPEFTYFMPGLNAELDLAVSPRLMLGLGFGWISRDWNPEWNFSDNSKTSYGPYKIDAVESISTGDLFCKLSARHAFLRTGPVLRAGIKIRKYPQAGSPGLCIRHPGWKTGWPWHGPEIFFI